MKLHHSNQWHHSLYQMDDEPFNPDYVEVDRVLDVAENTDENGEVTELVFLFFPKQILIFLLSPFVVKIWTLWFGH